MGFTANKKAVHPKLEMYAPIEYEPYCFVDLGVDMKRITLVLAFSVVLSSPAWCSDYNLGTLSPIATQTVALPLSGTTFNDFFYFTIGGVADSDLTVAFQGNPSSDTTFGTSEFSLSVWDNTNSPPSFSPITSWSDATYTFSYPDNLSPGDYLVHVGGSFTPPTINAEFPGSYTMTFTTAVPEPEVCTMLSVGLGLMGWVGRRRKLKAA